MFRKQFILYLTMLICLTVDAIRWSKHIDFVNKSKREFLAPLIIMIPLYFYFLKIEVQQIWKKVKLEYTSKIKVEHERSLSKTQTTSSFDVMSKDTNCLSAFVSGFGDYLSALISGFFKHIRRFWEFFDVITLLLISLALGSRLYDFRKGSRNILIGDQQSTVSDHTLSTVVTAIMLPMAYFNMLYYVRACESQSDERKKNVLNYSRNCPSNSVRNVFVAKSDNVFNALKITSHVTRFARCSFKGSPPRGD